MGSVCSAGKAEINKNGGKTLGCGGKLEKLKSFVKKSGGCYSNSKTSDRGKMEKKRNSTFSGEFKISNPSEMGRKQVSQRSSFLGRAGERAVEVLDTLGSSMPKLNTSNGFSSSMVAPRGNKISILAFEVANTISRGEILFQSLSEEDIQSLEKEIEESEGVQNLVSTDKKELISFLEADKRKEFNSFSREVARFGNSCKDPQWHHLDRYFSRLDLDVLTNTQPRVEVEKTMQELTALAHDTAELYQELSALERFEQDYQQKVKEMESLNLPLNGESLTAFRSELKHQRKLVRSLKKKSLWSRDLEEIVEKLVDIVIHIHQAILEYLGNYGTTSIQHSEGSQRLGVAGLALHYANIINQINIIASRPSVLPPNVRDTLYHGLPISIKNVLPSRLQNDDYTKELSIAQVKAEMDKILQWLTPFATNTTKAHQGFGWVGEWANTSNVFGQKTAKESNLIRLQTLEYADKQKIDFYILELLARLHHLVTFVRYRHNNNNSHVGTKTMPKRITSSPKGLHLQSKMLQFISLDRVSTQLSEEDRRLLEKVAKRKWTPGVSKSENLAGIKKTEATVWHFSNSVGSSPVKRLLAMQPQRYDVLDVMDGL
ncbi:protein PSK SIMULATOR 2-like isoform X2 [Lotus japonicus]|uniref:protein PSK SIMULATOR 2-like isoform X2 n=1 Tax=Lotus japonicus TaxID=34305 RepID=UPI00258A583E|nr:protein PSK SIMULATOR 2-like isoform X2 [Lotus japonicus]